MPAGEVDEGPGVVHVRGHAAAAVLHEVHMAPATVRERGGRDVLRNVAIPLTEMVEPGRATVGRLVEAGAEELPCPRLLTGTQFGDGLASALDKVKALLLEADGQRPFHSGDFPSHGRRGRLFERLISDPPKNVDVLLMEGTTLGRSDADQEYPSETDLERKLTELIPCVCAQETAGLPWRPVSGSPRLFQLSISLVLNPQRPRPSTNTNHTRLAGPAQVPAQSWPQNAQLREP